MSYNTILFRTGIYRVKAALKQNRKQQIFIQLFFLQNMKRQTNLLDQAWKEALKRDICGSFQTKDTMVKHDPGHSTTHMLSFNK